LPKTADQPKAPQQTFLPREEAKAIGVDPQTGERLPQLRRENSPTNPVADALEYAFQGIGGKAGFTKWAGRNRSDFYKMWGNHHKNQPDQVNSSPEIHIIHVLPPTKLDE